MAKHREITTKVNNERERLLNELAQIERLTMEQLAKDEAALDEVESKFIKNIPQITPFALSVSLVDTPVKLGTITTCLVPSRTRAIGAGLEYATVESNEFRLHPRGWLDEPIGGFDLADFGVSITPNAKTVITAETGSILCSYQIGEKVDHVITITFRGAPIGQFAAAFQHERNYRELHGTVVGESGGGVGQFRRPWGICALPNGAVAISDRANNRVQIITREGRVALVHPPEAEHVQNPPPGEGLFNRPAGIAFTHCPTPSLIVADKDNHKIQVFDFKTTQGCYTLDYSFSFGSKGTAHGEFEYPWDVAVNQHGQIAVADSRNHRIQLFTARGVFISKYGMGVMPNKYFDYPRGICFDKRDRLFVTDFNLHRVLVINKQFTEAHFVGSQGSTKGRFHRPQGITIDRAGRIIVADTKNKRIQIFNEDCTFLLEYQKLERPAGLCVTTDGRIAVVEEDEQSSQIVFL